MRLSMGCRWRPYTDVLFEANGLVNPGGVEDPFLYVDAKGNFHALFHMLFPQHPYSSGGHAYSVHHILPMLLVGSIHHVALVAHQTSAHKTRQTSTPLVCFAARELAVRLNVSKLGADLSHGTMYRLMFGLVCCRCMPCRLMGCGGTGQAKHSTATSPTLMAPKVRTLCFRTKGRHSTNSHQPKLTGAGSTRTRSFSLSKWFSSLVLLFPLFSPSLFLSRCSSRLLLVLMHVSLSLSHSFSYASFVLVCFALRLP